MKEEQKIRFIINEIAKGWEKGDTDVFRKYYTHESTARVIEKGEHVCVECYAGWQQGKGCSRWSTKRKYKNRLR